MSDKKVNEVKVNNVVNSSKEKVNDILKEIKEAIMNKKITEFNNTEIDSLIKLPFKVVYNDKYNSVSASLQVVPKALDLKPTFRNSAGKYNTRVTYQFFDMLRMLFGYKESATAIVKNVPVRFRQVTKHTDDGNEYTTYFWEALLAPNFRITGIFSNADVLYLKTCYLFKKFKLQVGEKTYVGDKEKFTEVIDGIKIYFIKEIPFFDLSKDDDFLEHDSEINDDVNLADISKVKI